ncbi:hypothetical protein [Sodalis glossinidius]|uniref:hypothetical protein n=1 Tax=Sodalis glossinidius TaxID=63612 RepID=UPI0013054166|nr:hypothetical protein [Sodalis glossinidius]
MSLPELKYYSLTKAAKFLKCETDDILYYASVGLLDVGVRLDFSEFIKKTKWLSQQQL